MKAIIFALVCAVSLAGCANGYTKFYHPAQGADAATVAARRAGPVPAIPQLERWAGSPDEAAAHFAQLGYQPIGYSSFNGAGARDSQALDQGKKVGADLVVVLEPHYTGTRTTAVPIVTPTSQTSVTNSQATAYSGGYSATAYGTSTTTSYGTQTNIVPISTDRFDFGAIYMVKARLHLGLFFRNLTDKERQSLGSNSGVVVMQVVEGSPAFAADILPGDIILSLDGERVSQASMQERLSQMNGRTVTFAIHRASGELEKKVTLAN